MLLAFRKTIWPQRLLFPWFLAWADPWSIPSFVVVDTSPPSAQKGFKATVSGLALSFIQPHPQFGEGQYLLLLPQYLQELLC
jgi:hypothetical protein